MWIVLLILAALIGLTIWKATRPPSVKGHGTAASFPIPVTMQIVGTTNFPIYIDGLGTVQAYNSVQINARVSGLIQEILFQEGQEVKQGDVLARIDPTTYRSQYDQSVSKTLQDTAQLESARLLLGRDEELLRKNVLDRQTYDTQRYLVAQLEGTVSADKAAEEYQKTQLDWTTVTAPLSGRTGARQIDQGNQVNAGGNTNGGSTIVTINQIKPIYVTFTLPQRDLTRIREAMGDGTNLPVEALEGNNRIMISGGELCMIDNQIDPSTSTVKLKALFQNADERLWPGEFVNVRLLLGTKKDAIAVPAEAVQIGPEGAYVYLIGEDETARMQAVKTGPTERGMTLIDGGLQGGEKIVTDGQYRLQPGSKITLGKQSDGKTSSAIPPKTRPSGT